MLTKKLLKTLDEWVIATGAIPRGGSWQLEIQGMMEEAYAAGEVAGSKDMRERCVKVCRDVEAENSVPPLIDLDAVECANRIWALGTT